MPNVAAYEVGPGLPLDLLAGRRSAAEIRAFADVMRDANGEYGRINELEPEEAAMRGCFGTLRSLHRRRSLIFNVELTGGVVECGHLDAEVDARGRLPLEHILVLKRGKRRTL